MKGLGAFLTAADRAVTVGAGASLGASVAIIEQKAEAAKELARLASRDEGFARSESFARHVRELESTFERIHMSGVKEYGEKEALRTGGKTRIGEVKENFMRDDVKLPAALREELAYLGPGIPAKESSYDNASDSGVAVRIFQFRPETYKELGFTDAGDTNTSEATDMKFLRNQVACANRFFEREYERLIKNAGPALALIRETYFPGNPERFERQFLPLVMLSIYHAGPDRAYKALAWFAEREKEPAQGYDVYELLSNSLKEENALTKGMKNDAVPGYGIHSSEYAQRVYAFARLIDKGIASGDIQIALDERTLG